MITATVTCDVCGTMAVLERVPLNEDQLARELASIGWSQRDDAFREVCPEHEDAEVTK